MTGTDDAAGRAARIARVEQGLPPVSWPDGGRLHVGSLDALMDRLDVPGVSVAVIAGGRLDWARGYGTRQAGSGDPVEVDTVFQAASISKPVSALAALRLVEQGRLDLDADVNDALASWRVPPSGDWQPRVTLRQLLSHSAGLTVHGFPGYRRDRPLPTVRQVLDGEPPANTPPIRVDTLPGARFRYSGGGYTVLQQLMVDVTGTPFPELLRALVLEPAGMTHSCYGQPPDGLPVAAGHRVGGGVVQGGWHVYPELGAATLWTTPSDLCRLALLLQRTLAGESSAILSPGMLREMLEPVTEPQMGLGFFLAGEGAAARFGHTGGNEGYRCELVVYRQGGFGAAVMVNSDEGRLVYATVLRAIAAAHGWPGYPTGDPPATVPGPAALDRFTGAYTLRPGYTLDVAGDGGRLMLAVPGQPALPLLAAADGSWIVPGLEVAVRFVDDGDAVTGLIVAQDGESLWAERLPA